MNEQLQGSCRPLAGRSCICSTVSIGALAQPHAEDRCAATGEFTAWLNERATEDGLQFIPFAGVTKADIGFLAVHPISGVSSKSARRLPPPPSVPA